MIMFVLGAETNESHRVHWLLYWLVGFDVLVGVYFRFTTSSKLWLDEAQSVNIATAPLHEIPHLLRLDGAPPAYYVLLHLWMRLFGSSDFAVRSMSGVISCLTLVVVYWTAKAWLGHRTALISVAIVAVLPYMTYYATETRMYALVMLLSALAMWTLKVQITRPSWPSTIALAALLTCLLYTHYWAIYLVSAIACLALIQIRPPREGMARSWKTACAVATSLVFFAPWLSVFNDQRLHTGTPWAAPAQAYHLFIWFGDFATTQGVHYIATSLHSEFELLFYVLLLAIGIFALPMSRRSSQVILEPRIESQAFPLVAVAFGSMTVGLTVSHFAGSAYVARYAAIVAIPISIIIALGLNKLTRGLRIFLVLALFSGASLWTDDWGSKSQRTQAGQVALALAHGAPGALVVVCPDQLGPSLLRYSPSSDTYIGYPRLDNPRIVNWIDYEKAKTKRSVKTTARMIAAKVPAGSPVYVVRADYYFLNDTCLNLVTDLKRVLRYKGATLVAQKLGGFYQPMNLELLQPTVPSAAKIR